MRIDLDALEQRITTAENADPDLVRPILRAAKVRELIAELRQLRGEAKP